MHDFARVSKENICEIFDFLKKVFVFALFLVCMSGCGQANPSNSDNGVATLTPDRALITPTMSASPTPEPSPTPVQPVLILLAPSGGDTQLFEALQPVLQELAINAGLQLQVVDLFDPSTTGSEVKGVVVLAPDPGAAAIAQAIPSVPVLAVGIPGIQSGANLNTIPLTEARPDLQGFLAGYLAAVVTPDWRVGVISQNETPQGQSSSLGFTNGVIFFCGLCRPAYPPFTAYPVLVNLPTGSGQAEIQAAVDLMVSSGVKTVYVAPSANEESLLQGLAQAGLWLIGSVPPPTWPGAELDRHSSG